jgi:hypothetical protein
MRAPGNGIPLRRTRLTVRKPRIKRAQQTVTPAPQKTTKIAAKGSCLEDEDKTCASFWIANTVDAERLREPWNLMGFGKDEVNLATPIGGAIVTMTGHSPTVSKAIKTTACFAAGECLIIDCAAMAASKTSVATTKTATAAGKAVSKALSPAVISYPPASHQ